MPRLLLFLILCYATACHQTSKPDEQLPAQGNNNTSADTTEIDMAKVSPAQCKVLLENDQVRVLRYSLKPGEKDNVHTHPPKTAYVVSGGKLRVFPENEKPFDTDEVSGTVEWGGYRGKHHVENIGNTTVTIVLTEVKSARKK